jgi:hypothetical protein
MRAVFAGLIKFERAFCEGFKPEVGELGLTLLRTRQYKPGHSFNFFSGGIHAVPAPWQKRLAGFGNLFGDNDLWRRLGMGIA